MDIEPLYTKILHGADYNPEQWTPEVWDEDVALMQQAHVNVATLPVFGWVSLQPDEETFTFAWLDDVIEKLHRGGVGVCLATATASVPAWLTQRYPDVLRVEESGRRLKHGGRHTFCPHSPNFRRLSVGLATKLAERYGHHPAVLAWHVSNEYGAPCYCDLCASAFRSWLEARYGSLEEVNQRWNTRFWGHTYTDWSQIETPTSDGERSMQGMLLDYDRFASQSLLDCYCAERDAIRPLSPHLPITTNMMGAFKALDYQKWAQEVDVVSWDCYPSRRAAPEETAFQHSLMRGLKEGQPWMLMEQTPSQQNWQSYCALKPPGVMRLWSYQAIAHGSETVMYFQWRRSRGACEQFHGAVVEHAGTPEARVFREVAALGSELEHLGQTTLGGRVQAQVAVLFDWENWWAVERSSGPSIDLKYVAQCMSYYGALHRNGIVADVVSPTADLSRYAVVIAPVFTMVKPGVAEKLEAYVQAGGSFLTTYFSGIVDENTLAYLGGYPGPLRRLLGIWVEEIDALSPEESNRVVFHQPWGQVDDDFNCGSLCDRVHLEGAQAIARYGDYFYAGEPAFTVNVFGRGRAYYLATVLERCGLEAVLRELCHQLQIRPPLEIHETGVEVVARRGPSGNELIYLLNHNAKPATVRLPPGRFSDRLTGNSIEQEVAMAAYAVSILQRE